MLVLPVYVSRKSVTFASRLPHLARPGAVALGEPARAASAWRLDPDPCLPRRAGRCGPRIGGRAEYN